MNLKSVFSRIKFNEMKPPSPARHRNRIIKIADAIEARFPEVNRSEKIKMKHIRWVLDHWYDEQHYTEITRGDYNRSLRIFIEALGKGDHWIKALGLSPKGPGGRPKTCNVVKSKKYYR